MLYVHHMHTLVCRVFKWNYEQLLYGQTFLSTDIRFARANAPLSEHHLNDCVEYQKDTYWCDVFLYEFSALDSNLQLNIVVIMSRPPVF